MARMDQRHKPRGKRKSPDYEHIPKTDFETLRWVVGEAAPDETDWMDQVELDAAALAPDPPDPGMSREAALHLRGVLTEIANRQREALRLYEPMPLQDAFHQSRALERVIRGGNRGGKTIGAAVEFARAVTGQDPYGKYPKEGRAIFVGKDLTHCSKVAYRKLFKPGPFKILKDPHTHVWRVYKPEIDGDLAEIAVNAPPLIPTRFYSPKDISWENKREEIPKSIRLKTGWEISFFSSLGEPPQGWDVDLGWFDEEIVMAAWYPEISARLIDRRGHFFWSATPQAGTFQLYELSVRASECKDLPDPPIEEFHVTLWSNTYLSQQSKEEFVDKIKSDDERRVRVDGDFALMGMKIYPEFNRKEHKIDTFEIPDTWTRYVAIDPGRQVCASLFAAVPPPDHKWAGKAVIYDELYIKKCNAKMFAERFRGKVTNATVYTAIIDHHAGRTTEIGSGRTVEEQYTDALKAEGVKFSRTDSIAFEWGSDDVKAGIQAVQTGLIMADGEPLKFLFMTDRLPWFLREIDVYSYRKINSAGTALSVASDEPLKLNDHLMDCLRYLAMHRLRWVPSKVKKRSDAGYTTAILKRKREKARKQSGWGGAVKVG